MPEPIGSSVSVAMCTFDGEAFVGEQLESIAAQSHLPRELVVCDDASADGTRDVVATFARTAPFPVRLVVNERRLGSTRNFEQAVSRCTGDLIALCDQDDIWYPGKLALQEQALHTQGAAGVFADGDVVGRDGERLGYRLWGSAGLGARDRARVRDGRAADVLLRRDVVCGATLLFEARLRDAILPIPEGWYHDGWIALVATALGGLGLVEQPVLAYRHHGGNQIGAAPPSTSTARLGSRVAAARRTEPAMTDLLARLRSGSARLRELSSRGADRGVIDHIEARVRHLEVRLGLPADRRGRMSRVARELASGRYHRFSAGTGSAVKDLVRP
jgi:glycosyltransferase involved in cell wall biosynthesis